MKDTKRSGKLRLPMQFDEAESDFLKVKPPKKKPAMPSRKKQPSR
jgi:hypothetical protein